jgi:hypothetical protein
MSGVSSEDLPRTCITDVRLINAGRSVEGRQRKSLAKGLIVSRSPTLSLETRKFARQSHAPVQVSRNAAFYRLLTAVRLGSIPIARSTSRIGQVTWGYEIGVNTLILWESVGNGRLGGGGLMASRIPVLPRDSHVPSHAAVHKNNLCDSHSLCVAAIVIAGGRTRTRSGLSSMSALRTQRIRHRKDALHCNPFIYPASLNETWRGRWG